MKKTKQTITKKIAYIAIATLIILIVPLVAMQFTNEVVWTMSDFIVMGALLFSTGLIYVLVTRNMENARNKLAWGIAILILFLYIWAELAVGIFTNLGS